MSGGCQQALFLETFRSDREVVIGVPDGRSWQQPIICPVYDAAYMELAQRRKLMPSCNDGRLRKRVYKVACIWK